MTILVGLGSGAYGWVVGLIIWYFVSRLKKHDIATLRAVIPLLGGAAVLYLVQAIALSDPEAKTVALSCYPFGLLLGWGLPALLDWDKKNKRTPDAQP